MMTCAVCGRKVLVLDTRELDSCVCVNCQIRLDNDGDLDAHLADELDERGSESVSVEIEEDQAPAMAAVRFSILSKPSHTLAFASTRTDADRIACALKMLEQSEAVEPMDELGATLTEDEQRERFAGYGRGGDGDE